MAAHRPPQGSEPPIETIDSTIDSMIDETAPPQKSPLRGVLPFNRGAPAGVAVPPPNAQPAPQHSTGEETAPAERSPLAAALPFRHAKTSASTTAIPMLTPEDLRRLTGGSGPGSPPGAFGPDDQKGRSAAERAKLEQAKTVAFAMPPPGFGGAQQGAPQPSGQGAAYLSQAAFQSPQGAPPSPYSNASGFGQGGASQAPSPQGQSRTPSIPPTDGPVKAKSTGHFGLSIEQYAALCAEVSASPGTAQVTFTKYGLAERKDQLTADLAWQERLRADDALMLRWQSLYLYYHEYYHRTMKR